MLQSFEYGGLLMEGILRDEQAGIIIKHFWVGG